MVRSFPKGKKPFNYKKWILNECRVFSHNEECFQERNVTLATFTFQQRRESEKMVIVSCETHLVFPFLRQSITFNNLKPFAFRLLIVNSNET